MSYLSIYIEISISIYFSLIRAMVNSYFTMEINLEKKNIFICRVIIAAILITDILNLCYINIADLKFKR